MIVISQLSINNHRIRFVICESKSWYFYFILDCQRPEKEQASIRIKHKIVIVNSKKFNRLHSPIIDIIIIIDNPSYKPCYSTPTFLSSLFFIVVLWQNIWICNAIYVTKPKWTEVDLSHATAKHHTGWSRWLTQFEAERGKQNVKDISISSHPHPLHLLTLNVETSFSLALIFTDKVPF